MKTKLTLSIIGFAIFAICSCIFVGCGNMDLFDYHWTFDEALVRSPDGSFEKVRVVSWHDYNNSDMIAVETKDKVICTHSCNVMLIKNK